MNSLSSGLNSPTKSSTQREADGVAQNEKPIKPNLLLPDYDVGRPAILFSVGRCIMQEGSMNVKLMLFNFLTKCPDTSEHN